MAMRRALFTALMLALLAPVGRAMAEPQVTLYYFHRNLRCVTCVALGDITAWVAEGAFKDRIADGTLEFRMVNYETPGNEHHIDDFDLEMPSAILAAADGDSVTTWKNLQRIWDLSEDHEGLEAYLKGEISAFLAMRASGTAP
ncbi:MAG: hypothetical protein IPK64_16905 [bacterium]|nr:hypothetical protein [bacterium]